MFTPETFALFVYIALYVVALMAIVGFVTSLVNGDGFWDAIIVGILFGAVAVVLIIVGTVIAGIINVFYGLSIGPITLNF